jgi:SAM-dependent methyltransferase
MSGFQSLRTALRLAVKADWGMIIFLAKAKVRQVDLAYASLDELGLSSDRSHDHGNSGGPSLARVLKSLSISSSDMALDVACGKAGAILTLAQFPFARVDGIELSERAVSIARQNLRKMGIEKTTIYHCDAARFTEYDRYTQLYMYHPFPEPVLAETLNVVLDSLLRCPRKLVLIFHNPVFHATILAAGFRKVSEFPGPLCPMAVYRAEALPADCATGR